MSLLQRSLRSSAYNLAAQGLTIALLFVRSVMLARLLSPLVFGVYAFAQAAIQITHTFATFGLGSAFIHRSEESEHPDAISVYFTLNAAFGCAWAVLVIVAAWWLLEGQRQWVLVVGVLITLALQLTNPAEAVLTKRIAFKRIAFLSILSAALTTPIAIGLAHSGAGIWSLLSVDLVGLIVRVIGLYLVRPVLRPRFGWSPRIAKYFLRFGGNAVVAGSLLRIIDRIDDLWTGTFLGDEALGFYSRAYTYANYPRRIIAAPLNAVSVSTYAEVKHRRRQLSRAFVRFNAIIIRASFLFAGAFFLASPEFVHIFLGEKWLPMLKAFRLMLIYTALDPIKFTVGHLFIAVGTPQTLSRIRLGQLVILLLGLVTLTPVWGISGVAVSATVMIAIGVGASLYLARRHVDFSARRLFAMPSLAVILAVGSTSALVPQYSSQLVTGAVKVVAFALVYVTVLLLSEREQVRESYRFAKHAFLGEPRG
ncbi:MAG: oligosaccharide flippase family protein [Anaerolineae bacterium]